MRKVYAGNTSNLGKGARCALPLHPSGAGFRSGIVHPFPLRSNCACRSNSSPTPFLGDTIAKANRTYRRSITRKGDFALPCTPSTWRAFLPPRPLTISWRRFQRDQPCAVWMPIRAFTTQCPRPFFMVIHPERVGARPRASTSRSCVYSTAFLSLWKSALVTLELKVDSAIEPISSFESLKERDERYQL